MQAIVDSDTSETLKFWWKVSSDENDDYLEFYIDDTLQDRISGEVDWTQKTYTIPAGIHTLKWRYYGMAIPICVLFCDPTQKPFLAAWYIKPAGIILQFR